MGAGCNKEVLTFIPATPCCPCGGQTGVVNCDVTGTRSPESHVDVDTMESLPPSTPMASSLGQETTYFSRETTELRQRQTAGQPMPSLFERYTFSSGATYQGEWMGYERHGLGQQTWTNGSKYSGQWAKNTASGCGQLVKEDGDTYIGQWEHGVASGRGIYRSASGATYEGGWKQDRPHGNGVETWPDGSRYEGNFLLGKKAGYGIFFKGDRSAFTPATTFAGGWKDNSPSGKGVFRSAEGIEVRGTWDKESVSGQASYRWPEGQQYHEYRGQFVENQREGFGVMRWKDGTLYQGWWQKGEQAGAYKSI